MASDVEHFFMCLLTFYVPSFRNVYSNPLLILKLDDLSFYVLVVIVLYMF